MRIKRSANPKSDLHQMLIDRGYEFRGNVCKTFLRIYPFITAVVIIDPRYVVEDGGELHYPTFIHWEKEPKRKSKKLGAKKTSSYR